ncbi:hypothetical protein HPB50_003596 [Hyalomma asiaticum]|uniref:Uncharacterized protein n=1 Tax=Hyalomma asiaticum TaxID=266040 RepID=A0ACB7T301_HYAAI|nr:hypothetical protein HPB50_003596 [Hyalomma asiaticum]
MGPRCCDSTEPFALKSATGEARGCRRSRYCWPEVREQSRLNEQIEAPSWDYEALSGRGRAPEVDPRRKRGCPAKPRLRRKTPRPLAPRRPPAAFASSMANTSHSCVFGSRSRDACFDTSLFSGCDREDATKTWWYLDGGRFHLWSFTAAACPPTVSTLFSTAAKYASQSAGRATAGRPPCDQRRVGAISYASPSSRTFRSPNADAVPASFGPSRRRTTAPGLQRLLWRRSQSGRQACARSRKGLQFIRSALEPQSGKAPMDSRYCDLTEPFGLKGATENSRGGRRHRHSWPGVRGQRRLNEKIEVLSWGSGVSSGRGLAPQVALLRKRGCRGKPRPRRTPRPRTPRRPPAAFAPCKAQTPKPKCQAVVGEHLPSQRTGPKGEAVSSRLQQVRNGCHMRVQLYFRKPLQGRLLRHVTVFWLRKKRRERQLPPVELPCQRPSLQRKHTLLHGRRVRQGLRGLHHRSVGRSATDAMRAGPAARPVLAHFSEIKAVPGVCVLRPYSIPGTWACTAATTSPRSPTGGGMFAVESTGC